MMTSKTSVGSPPHHFSVDRLSALSDGVFAVAMTLLAYNVRVPRGPLTDAQLHLDLGGLMRDLRVLCLSFAVAGMFWRGQVKLLEVMRHSVRPPLTASLVFLFFVVLLPITTGLSGTFGAIGTVAPLYVGNLAVLALTQLGVWLLALNGSLLDRRMRLLYLTPSLFVSVLFLVATLVSFSHPVGATELCVLAFASPLLSRLVWREEPVRLEPSVE